MAFAATETHSAPSGVIARFFNSLLEKLVAIGESSHLYRQIEALHALSDEELANRGLKREDIARYVLSSHYWG